MSLNNDISTSFDNQRVSNINLSTSPFKDIDPVLWFGRLEDFFATKHHWKECLVSSVPYSQKK